MTNILKYNSEKEFSGSAVQQLVECSFDLSTPCKSAFFYLSDPSLLDLLTPPWFRLRIVAADPVMDVGARIDYRMRWRGLSFRWQSEITVWQPPFRFTYRQRRGPYKFFEHEHLFVEGAEGTRVTDRIRFRAPGGALVEHAIVGPELKRILSFRRRRALELLGPHIRQRSSLGARQWGTRDNPVPPRSLIRVRQQADAELSWPCASAGGHQAPDLGYQEAEEETHSDR